MASRDNYFHTCSTFKNQTNQTSPQQEVVIFITGLAVELAEWIIS